MDPLRHISLVKELGIDWCIPRMLLAVKPAQLARVTISPAVESTASKNLVVKAAATPLVKKSTPKIDFGLDKPKTVPQTAKAINFKQRPRLVTEQVDSFNLLVAVGSSLVFIVDVKTNPLTAVWERSVRQFFDEIETACGSNSQKVQPLDYFSWPIAGSTNVNLGEDQLIQLLAGFMRQRILGDKKGVILFGDNAKQYGTSVVSDINKLQVIAAPNLGVMFTSVAVKAALWRDLQALEGTN